MLFALPSWTYNFMLLQILPPQIAYLIYQTDYMDFLRHFGFFC